jgi:hypothetical protein
MRKIYFGRFPTKCSFLRSNLRQSTLRRLYDECKYLRRNWCSVALILRYPNCPDDIRRYYVGHHTWYKRLVAMLSQTAWPTYLGKALRDPKSTVRAAALRRAMFEGGMVSADEAKQFLKKDKGLQGYFKEFLRTA